MAKHCRIFEEDFDLVFFSHELHEFPQIFILIKMECQFEKIYNEFLFVDIATVSTVGTQGISQFVSHG